MSLALGDESHTARLRSLDFESLSEAPVGSFVRVAATPAWRDADETVEVTATARVGGADERLLARASATFLRR
jgi:hypothetical protein